MMIKESMRENTFTNKREKFQHHLRAYRLPILSGLLLGTSNIPFPPWALFFCLVPLWLFWYQRPTLKQALYGGWLAQFIGHLIGFHWIAYTAVAFGNLPVPLGVLVLLLFCSCANLTYALAGPIWLFLTSHLLFVQRLSRLISILLLVAVFALSEYYFPKIFPWNLGYSWLWFHLPGAQSADFWGFDGLNFITILVNGLMALAMLRHREKIAQWWRPIAVAVALFILVNIFGLYRQNLWNATEPDAELKFLIVQGNIGNFEKQYAELGAGFQGHIIQAFLDLTRNGLEKFPDSDYIIWPETAFPAALDPLFQNERYPQMLLSQMHFLGKPLLTGSYSMNSARDAFNSLFLVTPEGTTPIPPYRKTILLAFGEYFPGAQYLPAFVKRLYPMSDFGRGGGPTVMRWRDQKFGPQICYEGLYPIFSAESAQKGAEIFINVANDSWYGNTFEPHQHLYLTYARAIEMRRPLVRATNTGISSAILASGEILEQSPQDIPWVGQYKIKYRVNPPHTFYEKIAAYWGYILAIFALSLLVFVRGIKKRAPNN